MQDRKHYLSFGTKFHAAGGNAIFCINKVENTNVDLPSPKEKNTTLLKRQGIGGNKIAHYLIKQMYKKL